MKKLILPLLVLIIVLAACGNNGGSGKSDSKEETKSYKLDSGIKNPKDPKRIAVVAPTFAGGLHKLGANIVAVNNQVDQSPILKEKFKDTTKIGEADVEKVAKKNLI